MPLQASAELLAPSGPDVTHHLHGVIVDELLGSHAVDLVHKALLVREEVVEFVRQLPAEGDAAFVALV